MSEVTAGEIFDMLRGSGLFLCPLNNGDWACGRATKIYHIHIVIDADPFIAILKAAEKSGKRGS